MPTRRKPAYEYSESDQRKWRRRAEQLTMGEMIRAHRLSEGWSQVDAAERLGISKQQLSDYENGRKVPSVEKAYEIAEALDIPATGLVERAINEQLKRAKIPLRATVEKRAKRGTPTVH